VDETTSEDEKRIWIAGYFHIYFRSAVPEEMFSNAELDQVHSTLDKAETLDAVGNAFNKTLDSLPLGHPKRADFLWRLNRRSHELEDETAE